MINGKTYGFSNTIRNSAPLRESFNALAQLIYNFDFEPWTKAGYWDDNYRPYVLTHDNIVVSVASVNTIRFRFNGRPRNYIQIGTVMTHPAFRGRGLSRWLLERILADGVDNCVGMDHYAKNSALDFYS